MIMRTGRGGKGRDGARRLRRVAAAAWGLLMLAAAGVAGPPPDWPQWGRNPQHTGVASVAGQPLRAIVADYVYDPFVELEKLFNENELLAHYPAPLVDGSAVYMMFKTGSYAGPGSWDSEVWNVQKLRWNGGALEPEWLFVSDWKAIPLTLWEPVFQPALAGDSVFVPGVGGAVFRVSKETGVGTRINPFPDLYSGRFVAGGLAADEDGTIVYNAMTLLGRAGSFGSGERARRRWRIMRR